MGSPGPSVRRWIQRPAASIRVRGGPGAAGAWRRPCRGSPDRSRFAGEVRVPVAGVEDDRVADRPVREAAAEARMHSNVDEHAAGAQNSRGLPQHGRVVGHVGVGHHGQYRVDRPVGHGQCDGVGPRHRQTRLGVGEHAAQQVDPDRRPTEPADLVGVGAGAAADLQADPVPAGSRSASAARMPSRSLNGSRNTVSYQSAISS